MNYRSTQAKTVLAVLLLEFCSMFCMSCAEEHSATEELTTANGSIRTIMSAMAENGQFSGAVLVSVADRTIYQDAFGMADFERGEENTVETRFRIASLTKPFTTLLVCQLVAEGKLSLDDELIRWIPEFPASKGKGITIGHLLRHESGIIGEWRIPELEQIERHRWTESEMLQEISKHDLIYEPGKGWEYSNFGYFLLSVAISRAGGAPYNQLLQERICRPAGMVHTIPDDNDAIIPGRALGYHLDYFAGPQHAPYLDMSFTTGYGHLLSTVEDLNRFAAALDNPEVLPVASRTAFFEQYGWTINQTPIGTNGRTENANSLSGSINGFGSHMLRIEEKDIFITLLKNVKEPGAQVVIKWPEYATSRILAVLYDEPYEMPRKSAAFAVFQHAREAGVEAARLRYKEMTTSDQPEFYYDPEEFKRLAELWPDFAVVQPEE